MTADSNLALRTDLYELTMMQGYWATGRSSELASFELFFRTVPEGGGYAVAAGIEAAIDICLNAHFSSEQLDYLSDLGMFQTSFLEALSKLRFSGNVRAVPEGSVVFPHEPMLEVTGPLLESQWLETQLLNCVNFQTLIATKASRIIQAAKPATVVDFGLRRAHGPNGGLWASRSAYLAGCTATSNVESGFAYGIPLQGTHAHSWVMSFPTEVEAFRAYAEVFPDHTVLLIDTYDTLDQGLKSAIRVGLEMKAKGHSLRGVRLDSGDLAYLSKACRRELDEAGLNDVQIVASSDIDEYVIENLKMQQAEIDVYGVGTRLATAFQEPALGGVYKIVALEADGQWIPKLKVSSNPAKTTIPGRKQIYRWESGGQYLGDALAMLDEKPPERMRHRDLSYKQTEFRDGELLPLLETRIRDGARSRPADSLTTARRARATRSGKATVGTSEAVSAAHLSRGFI
ncbi:MAG: nicotinate phosphoribosyltransferase [Planctomycetota bacterium]